MDIAIRAFVAFFIVLLITRVVGRRELSSMEPFDLILLVVLGDAIQQGLTQDDYSVTGAMIVISTIGSLAVATSYLNFRIPWLRRVLDGQPIVMVQDGKVIEKNLRRELAQMAPIDFVLLIVLGDAIQQGLTQDDYSVTGAMIVIATIAAIQVSVSWFAFRFKRVRRFLEGEPLVLVQMASSSTRTCAVHGWRPTSWPRRHASRRSHR